MFEGSKPYYGVVRKLLRVTKERKLEKLNLIYIDTKMVYHVIF